MSKVLPARFVVLRHTLPSDTQADVLKRAPGHNIQSHFDLMLESDEVLLTWELSSWPPTTNGSQWATRLPDHRLAYLDYEGPISGNRGAVVRVDEGVYEMAKVPEEDACEDKVIATLHGDHFNGTIVIESGQLTVTAASTRVSESARARRL